LKTEARRGTERSAGRPRRMPTDPLRTWIAAALLIGCIALVVMAFFLSIYPAKRFTVPIGWDTSRYLWRTSLAQALGIADMQSGVPFPVQADPGRPAFPVIAATLSSLLQVHTFRVAAVLPAVTAAAIGLGAGAFIAATLRRPAWELAVAALGVGTSAFLVRLAGPETYQDNLFAAAVFMAAAIPLVLSIADRRAIVPAILLFGAGGVVHWAFFAFMMATLLLTTAFSIPASLRRWRSEPRQLFETPAARLLAVAAGAASFAAAAIFGLLSAGTRSPQLSIQEIGRKFGRDIHKYNFAVTLPLAGLGAASLVTATRRPDQGAGQSGFVLTFLLAWSGVTLAGVIGLEVLQLTVPAHRFLAFALAVPVLAVLGLLWVVRAVAHRARGIAIALLIASLAGAGYMSHLVWFRTQTWMDATKIQDATRAGAYLDTAGIGRERSVVFIVAAADSSYTALMGQMVRASLPTYRIDDAHVYVGSADDYLARRATPGPTDEATELSERYFKSIRPTYGMDPVALLLKSFNAAHFDEWSSAHPESVAAENVAVVKGPRPSLSVPEPLAPVGGLRAITIGFLAVGAFATFWLVGLGWSLVLLGRWMKPLHIASVAPAVGIAALVIGGVIVDRLGVRLAGLGGAATPAIVAALGWAAAARAHLRRRQGLGIPGSASG
jgi:hypothetical protein